MSEEYFKTVYTSDPRNAAKQSENEYLDYAMGRRGAVAVKWAGLIEQLVKGLTTPVADLLNARLLKLGNRAIGEWAKDNNIRAFDEKPLIRWEEKLKEAKTQDQGDGSKIQAALDDVEKELDSFIQKRGLLLL